MEDAAKESKARLVMQYIEAISWEKPKHDTKLFLAGGITNCSDWQKQVVESLRDIQGITVFNPRRANFDVTNSNASKDQIFWEYHRIREATHIMFWFTPETLCPITLFELGAALERNHNLIIGCHPDYKRKFDVEYQASLKAIFNVQDSLEDTINLLRNSLL